MAPVLGDRNTERLIRELNALETVDDVRRLRSLWTAG
jgi:hypothetical protein